MDPEISKLVMGLVALAGIIGLEFKALAMGINGTQLRLAVVLLAAAGGFFGADAVKTLLSATGS